MAPRPRGGGRRVYFWAQRQGLPAAGQYGSQPVPAGMYLDQQSGLMLPQGTERPARAAGSEAGLPLAGHSTLLEWLKDLAARSSALSIDPTRHPSANQH
jgi:hypothetical protein